MTGTIVYYFTGTGNSLMIARTIASRLESAEAVPITKAISKGPKADAGCVGLVFPVYWGGLPKIVQRFVSRFSGSRDTYFFGVATHAGGPGSVLPQLQEELQRTGHDLSSGYDIEMPSNYVIGYAAPTERTIQARLNAADTTIDEIVKTVAQRATHRAGPAFPPYSGQSRAYQRFIAEVNASDESYWVTDECTECGVCAEVCPVKNIHMKDGRPEWLHRCEQCLACINWCPSKAIQHGKGTVKRGRYTNPRVSVDDIRL